MKRFTFITGNQNKADYLSVLLGLPVKHHKAELDEIQTLNIVELVEHKAKQAYELIKSPVLVEDVSLEFNALSKLPGTFVKFFVDHTGLEATCRMLDGFTDKSAIARCGYGYYDGSDFTYFEGSHSGTIADHPSSGIMGFGWDQIFIPSGFGGRIRADLNEEEYNELYLKIKPIEKVRLFLTSN